MPENSLLIIIAVTVALIVGFLVLRALSSGAKPDAIEQPEPAASDVPAPAPVAPQSAEDMDESADTPPQAAELGDPDPLTQIKGLGPKKAATLNAIGVIQFAQIAAWSETDIATLETDIGPIADRIARDRWVEQAGLLAAGDIAGFEAKFGKLG